MFNILAHRWRCLLTTLQIRPHNGHDIVIGTVTLHNRRCVRFSGAPVDVYRDDDGGNVIPGTWLNDVELTYAQIIGGMKVKREGKR